MTRTLLAPEAAARQEALTVLLRCWLRETGVTVPGPGPLAVALPATGRALVVTVARRSPTGHHDLAGAATPDGVALDVEDLAALLTAEAGAGLPPGRAAHARARIVDSVRRAARYAALRAADPADPAGLPGWIAAEQGLLAGHPWHPMTKSRDGLSDAEDARYAPERRGRFPLHWFAASPAAARTGGRGDVAALLRGLAGDPAVPAGYLPVPAHPWQAARLRERPGAAALLSSGDLVDLGPSGPDWWATSSLRTVARPGAALQLKLSVGLRVTNSRRENQRAELELAARVAALTRAGLGARLAASHPGFGLVNDPAWVGVDAPDGPVGLDALLREQPFDDRARCAGALVDARPDRGRPLVADLAAADPLGWYRAFLGAVALPLLWLHGTWGIGLEAHLQNLVVGLDGAGLPVRAWYRDSQGWYADRPDRVEALLPGVADGVALVHDPALVTRRVAYYLGVNTLLGVAGTLAAAGAAAEEDLLRVLVAVLRGHARGPDPSPVAELLLDAETLPAKANLLTGVDGRDELDGAVATQSVYVEIPNPLREVQ